MNFVFVEFVLIGCLISFPDYFGDVRVLRSGESRSPPPQAAPSSSPTDSSGSESEEDEDELGVELCTREELKSLVVQALALFGIDEISSASAAGVNGSFLAANSNSQNNTAARCTVLCSLTCFIHDEIYNQKWHAKRLNDAIKRIFKDLDLREVNNKQEKSQSLIIVGW